MLDGVAGDCATTARGTAEAAAVVAAWSFSGGMPIKDADWTMSPLPVVVAELSRSAVERYRDMITFEREGA